MDEESASPTVQDVERAGIQADHSHMCKFESDNAPGFDLVVEGIQRYAEAAPDTIRPRWEAEKDERATQRRFDANELNPREYPSSGGCGIGLMLRRRRRNGKNESFGIKRLGRTVSG